MLVFLVFSYSVLSGISIIHLFVIIGIVDTLHKQLTVINPVGQRTLE